MQKKIPFNRPTFIGGEVDNVIDATKRGSLGGNGHYTKKCQQWITQHMGGGRTFLTTSCTSALEMAAILMDIKYGDEVIVPSYTYVSTINAFLLRGATLVYVDVDPGTMNIDHKLIAAAITQKTRAIVVVHYAGVACEMDSITTLARDSGVYIVEDAAQALTSKYHSRSLGSIGDIGCFSFHETKNFTSGGQGGAISINNEELLARAEVVYDNGTNRMQFLRGLVDYYHWEDIGSNFFMSEVQAAYLWAQLDKSSIIQEQRSKLWRRYRKSLRPLAEQRAITLPLIPDDCEHNAHIFFFKCLSAEQRNAFIAHMDLGGVVVCAHFVPLHSRPIGLMSGRFVGQDRFTTADSQCLVRLPLHYSMSVEEQNVVIEKCWTFFKKR
ncbi:PLP-dependent transferase [Glarea lozoyensis ATCC 20868]|uniref:PLP-dependent transferase n=1 Tax=Glarea lozoyensis (strain ATCC 20868 / MF5171) TaxID=1116229 RepID=S3CGC6_GLAL2|nr:PLP-dependent transferase [Glarea lozoyensis ATCC 20868]EPE24960.1 PLP-dependent transferase [Glarea lozoyensis ATCC 20868]